MPADDQVEFVGDPFQKLPITFSIGNYMVDIAVDQRVVIAREALPGFVKS